MKLNKKAQEELNKITKKVDEDFKELWDLLDENSPEGFTHKDVCGFGCHLYIIDKETQTRVYMKDWKNYRKDTIK